MLHDDFKKEKDRQRQENDDKKVQIIEKEKRMSDSIKKQRESGLQLMNISYRNRVSKNIQQDMMNKTMEDWQIKGFSPRINKDKKGLMA